jgi:hypothetical protein
MKDLGRTTIRRMTHPRAHLGLLIRVLIRVLTVAGRATPDPRSTPRSGCGT